MKITQKLALLILISLSSIVTKAQLSGSYTVPGSFTSVASAISSLNIGGVTGAVTINISAGYTETVSTGGYSLYTIVGASAANTVTFRKSGTGANPILYSYTGTKWPYDAVNDGMWRFIGADYVTIDGINFTDNKTTNPATMEFAIAFFKANGNNGCQHNQITNCVISLSQNNNVGSFGPGTTGSKGIEVVGAAPASHTVPVTPLTVDGSNSYNSFSANLIQNCNYGITLSSTYTITNAALCDRGNTVGGPLAVNGNTIMNYGSGSSAPSGPAGAVYFDGQFDLNISNNLVNSGSGTPHDGTEMYGLQGKLYNHNLVVTNNTLTVKCGNTCPNLYGISNQNFGFFLFTNNPSIKISGNTFTACTTGSSNYATSFYGIYTNCDADSVTLSSNTFTGCTMSAYGHSVNIIYNGGAVAKQLTMSNNLLSFNVPGTYAGYFSALNNSGTVGSALFGNNTFNNIVFGTGSTSFNADMILNSGPNTSLSVLNNTFLPMSFSTSGITNFIYNTSLTQSLVLVAGNSVAGFTNSTTGNIINGYYGINASPASSTVNISNNSFNNIQGYASTFYGIRSAESVGPFYSQKIISNNLLANNRYFASWTGLELDRLGDANGAAPSTVSNNTITTIFADVLCRGISTASNSGNISLPPEIFANAINSLSCAAVFFYDCTGILANAGPTGMAIYRNKITNIASGNSYPVTGLKVTSTSTISNAINIYNNLVAHMTTSTNITSFNMNTGISVSGNSLTAFRVYYNTVYLANPVLGGAACLTSGTTVDSRNNLLVNLSNGGGSSTPACAFFGSNVYNAASNTNLFYAGSNYWNGLFSDVGNIYTTMAAFRTAVQGREQNSVSENVVFTSTLAASAGFLTPSASVPTQVESGATPVSWITTDFYGNARNANTPDIGAIEGNYIRMAADSIAPVISGVAFNSLPCNTSVRTLTAQLYDASGVATGSLAPKAYYTLNSGTYSVSTGVLASGTNSLGVYTFSLPYTAAYGDVVSWFIIAQDASTLTNVSAWPPVGLVASSVNSISTLPTPLSYTVNMALSGTYTVGSAGTFSSLTQAANAYNNACLTGSVTFVLNNPVYTLPAETFPIVFKNNADASSTNSLLIIPAAGQTVSVNNGTQAAVRSLIKFEDARYITISNNAASGSRLLLSCGISASSSSLSALAWITSGNVLGAGSKYITLRGLDLFAGSNLNSYGIVSNLNTVLVKDRFTGAYGNDFITIDGNRFRTLEQGVYAIGYDYVPGGASHNWTVKNNLVGPSVPSASENITASGLSFGNITGLSVLNNTVCNISNPSGSGATGITLEWATNTATVGLNTISSISSTVSTTGDACGISVLTRTGNSNVLLHNNMISDINGLKTIYNHAGICVGNSATPSGGIKIYNNTVSLIQGSAFTSTANTISACLYLKSATGVDIKNNLLYSNVANTGNSFSKNYCIYMPGSSFTGSSVDYNNYYHGSSAGFLAGPSPNAASLAAVQAATGQNMHSTNLVPAFISPVDAHIDPLVPGNLLLKNTGAPISLYATDIDNQARNITTPDVGADEFVMAAICNTAIGGTVSPASYTICGTQSLSLISSGVSSGIGTGYQWQSAATAGGSYSVLSAGSGTNSYNYNTTGQLSGGIYYLRLLATCPNGSLSSASNEVTVTVIPPPSLSITSTGSAVCGGSSVTLTASGASSYTWSTGATTASIVVTPTASTNYFVTYGSAPCTFSTSQNIGIYTSTSPTVTAAAVSSVVCAGSAVTLTASGANTYAWSNGMSGATITTTPSANTVYTVTGYNAAGCGATATTSITANPVPTLSISGPTLACAGATITLTASGANTFTWSNGSNSNSITVAPTTNTVYSVSGSSLGCSAGLSYSVNTSIPAGISITGQTVICSGQSTTLTASGYPTFSWSTGASTASISVTPTATTAYTVTGLGGCTNSAVVNVSVNATPTLAPAGNTVICNGQTTTLSVSGASTYSWNTGATTSSIVVSPSTSSLYIVLGTSTAGCVSNTVFGVLVNPVPVLTITPASATVCALSPVTLSAAGASTFTWSSGATSAITTVTPSAATVYTVTGTVLNCSASKTIAVSTSSLPLLFVSPASATVCAQSPVSFTASGAGSYTWNNGGGNNAAANYTANASTVYTVSGTDVANGCVNSTTVAVVTNSLPILSIAGPTALCAGQNATLIATGATTYSWTTPSSTSSLSISPLATTVYSLIGIAINGCSSIASHTVTLNALPTLSISASSTLVCAASPATLSASGANTYTWSGGTSGNSIVVVPSANSTYSVSGMNTAGCVSSQSISIHTQTPAVIVITPASATVCAQSPISFNASGAASYTWSNGGGNTASASYSPAANSVYTVTATDVNGCSSSGTATVTVNALPVISVSGSPTVCAGAMATFTASGAATYTWLPGNQPGTTYTPAVDAAGVYTVTGIDANGCGATATVQLWVDPCTALKNIGASTSFIRVSPNPSSGVFELSCTVAGIKHIRVLNNLGQLVYTNSIASESTSIELTEKAKGVYTVVVEAGSVIERIKVIIE